MSVVRLGAFFWLTESGSKKPLPEGRLTALQYEAVSKLFNEMNDEFHRLTNWTKCAYYDILFERATFKNP